MAKTLTIQLSDELESKLTAQAQKLNLSLEDLILQSLSQSAKQENISEFDPILPLLGTLKFENSDVEENHDRYLQQALQQELKIGE
ncbi:hypothetical protein [Nostoc sp. 'Peltigera malacea cyanobiont' DB3992]|uniref:hypothetical protein n=1 Tax=Nostoc sp. 'Peltigera malacea cyanobiont' DB3992 TaxID=1206980 RepID=UPI000C055855|nr:hypothetical protein [Nostoc sp. 'Peltigera malacea cyanobiont' DB3992]PHM09325.1 hypothetical protein CK516_15310 [Nostoc sp. 'Peltigera malacea cyanobiont' DB3992]